MLRFANSKMKKLQFLRISLSNDNRFVADNKDGPVLNNVTDPLFIS